MESSSLGLLQAALKVGLGISEKIVGKEDTIRIIRVDKAKMALENALEPTEDVRLGRHELTAVLFDFASFLETGDESKLKQVITSLEGGICKKIQP